MHDARDPQTRSLHGEDVNLRIRLKRLGTSQASSAAEQGIPDVLVAFEGSLRSPYCQRVELEGVARTTDGAWTLEGDVAGLTWSTDMSRQLPSFLAEYAQRLSALRGRGDIRFQLGRKSRDEPLNYQVNGHVAEADWQDPKWNQPISNISGDFSIDPSGSHVRQLTASYGTARLSGNLDAAGCDLSQPYALTLRLDRFPLTSGFVATLPASLQEAWQKFHAEGVLSGELRVQFDGRQHRYQSELTTQQLSLKHYKFPYPIDECQGTLKLTNDACQFDLAGSAGGTPINLRGVIQHPGPRFTGWWEAKTTRWKVIDDALVSALPTSVENFIRRLQLRGNVGFWVRHQRDDPDSRPPPEMIVAIDQGFINYDGFPYPINKIQGRLEAHNGRWSFNDLTGWNDNCQILCNGYWDTRDASKPLALRFQLQNVGLDDELKHALRPAGSRFGINCGPTDDWTTSTCICSKPSS